MKEIWKDIKGFEGLYQVSSFGRVKGLERMVKNRNGYRYKKELILTDRLTNKGYKFVTLCDKEKQKKANY